MRYLFSVLVIPLVFSSAYAGLSITVGPEGAGADVGAEYTASRGQTLWIGVYAQDMPDTGQFGALLYIVDDTGIKPNGSFVGSYNLYIPPAIGSAQTVYYPYMPWVGEYWDLINFDESSSVSGNGLIADYEYYCDSEGDVVIDLMEYNGMDTLTIHQGPPVEPFIEVAPNVTTFNTILTAGNPGPETLSISNDGPGTLNWSINESCSWLSASPSSGSCTSETDVVTLSVDISGLGYGTHSCELSVSDPNAINDPYTVTVYLNIGGVNIPGKGDYATIQAAINAAVSGVDTVIVHDGTYKGVGNRNIDFLGKAITVRSENGPENCIIDCEWADSGFVFQNGETTSSVLKGFTITHGLRASGNGGAIVCDISSPMITDCILRDNGVLGGTSGPGINFISSSAVVERCIMDNNNGSRGGGIYARDSDLRVSNCLITNNTVYSAGATAKGGGIDCRSNYHTSRFTNCTVVDNVAEAGGGISIIAATAIITNCIFRNNLPNEIYISNGTPIVTYSDISDGFSGGGNIDVDPQFAGPGDYHLTFGSLCIDSGTNSPPTGLPATDLDGVARPLDGDGNGSSVADMGSYEFYYDPGSPIVVVSPLDFYFSCPVGGPDPNSQTMGIRNGAGGTLNWQITEDCDWLTVGPGTGSSSGEVDDVVLTADSSGLAADMYNCLLCIQFR